MKKAYTAPSIELLGSLHELTASEGGINGCKGLGGGKEKIFTHTDGHGNGQTGCLS
jgi:hypothetical protein